MSEDPVCRPSVFDPSVANDIITDWCVMDQIGITLATITPARCLHFGPNISIDYGADPPKVTLNGATPDEAARAFWNAVHAVVGRPPLFPETAAWDPWENAGGSNDRTD